MLFLTVPTNRSPEGSIYTLALLMSLFAVIRIMAELYEEGMERSDPITSLQLRCLTKAKPSAPELWNDYIHHVTSRAILSSGMARLSQRAGLVVVGVEHAPDAALTACISVVLI